MLQRTLEAGFLTGFLIISGGMIGCGGEDETPSLPDIETLFPANDAVGSWVEDITPPKTAGIDTALSDSAVIGMVNGDADPFVSRGFVAFARQFYMDGTYTLEFRVWQMISKAEAKDVYAGLLTEVSQYDLTWTALALGEEGRVGNTGSTWWINTHKNAYHVEASSITPNDAAGQTAALNLVKAALTKIP